MQSHVVDDGPLAPSQGLVRLAGRLAAPGDDDDLVQSTMVRALEFDGDIREREAWLRRVLINERFMQIRADRRREARETGSLPEDAVLDVEQVVQCIEIARIVGDLIDALDEPTRKVIRARFFDDESSADIARRQGVPAGTVRWRLKTGLDHLRRELDARHGGRRAVWAGVFGPTLGPAAASGIQDGGSTTLAATRGTTMFGIKTFGIKTLIGVALTAGAVGGASAVMVRNNDDASAKPSEATRAASTVTQTADAHAKTTAPLPTAPPLLAEARVKPATPSARPQLQRPGWEARRRDIRRAHGVPDLAVMPRADVPPPSIASCASDGCFDRLIPEVTNLVEACRDFVGETTGDVALRATIIGSPDVGTIVESVELVGTTDVPADLRECLTETMYTMDLGPASSDFEQQIDMQLSTMPADGDFDRSGIDPAVQAEIEHAIEEAKNAQATDGAPQVRAIHLDHGATRPH